MDKKLTPKQKIIKALDAASHFSGAVAPPYNFVSMSKDKCEEIILNWYKHEKLFDSESISKRVIESFSSTKNLKEVRQWVSKELNLK